MNRLPNEISEEPIDPLLVEQVLPLIDQQWELLLRGESVPAAAWIARHPEGAAGLGDLRVLEALRSAARALLEDSQSCSPIPATTPALPCDSPSALASRRGGDMTPTQRTRTPGDRLGKFELRELLGRGGQAETWKAWDPDTERHVVLKAYHAASLREQWDGVLREGQRLSSVTSDFLPRCYGVERLDETPCLIMEYVPGRSLSVVHKSNPLSGVQSLTVVEQIAHALSALHRRGLVHRDVKPTNIIAGDDGVYRLVDLGLAARPGEFESDGLSGTIPYMSPEQSRGEVDRIDARTDVFGLGSVWYYLLTGGAPFDAKTRIEAFEKSRIGDVVAPRLRDPRISPTVNALCMQCLAKSPESRFESANALADAVGELLRPRWKPNLTAILTALALVFVVYRIARRSDESPSPRLGIPASAPSMGTANSAASRLMIRVYPGGAESEEPRAWGEYFRVLDGDSLRIEAEVNPAAFVYLVWIDPAGQVIEMFPHDELSGVHHESTVQQRLEYPALPGTGVTVGGDSGGEQILVLFRGTALPENLRLAEVIGDFRQQPTERRRCRWFSESQSVSVDERGVRGPVAIEPLDDPLESLRVRIRDAGFDGVLGVQFLHTAAKSNRSD